MTLLKNSSILLPDCKQFRFYVIFYIFGYVSDYSITEFIIFGLKKKNGCEKKMKYEHNFNAKEKPSANVARVINDV